MTSWLRLLAAVFAVLLSGRMLAAEPIDRAELESLRARVRELEGELRAIAQRLDDQAPPHPGAPPESPSIPPAKASITDRGYTFASADEANSIRLRGLVQLDARAFFHDGDAATDTFILRRARLISEGMLARRYGFHFVTEFGGNDFNIRDASLTAQFADWAQLKAGKFKAPVGLELLQAGQVRPMVERSLVTNFVSIRDVGVQLGGDLFAGGVNYALGVFNGMPDGGISTNVDHDEPKDVAARLMWHPWRHGSGHARPGLAIGVGASRGRQRTAAGHLPLYRTDGQQVFFSYRPGVTGDGETSRLSPQFDYRIGPLGVTGEWIVSSTNVQAGLEPSSRRLGHRAWQLTSSYVLTGEESSFHGLVPHADFVPGAGGWGAFEIVARYAAVEMDDAAFPAFAAPETNASDVSAIGLGLNWHLSKAVRFMFNYTRSRFDVVGPVRATPMLRNGERVFASRLQLAF